MPVQYLRIRSLLSSTPTLTLLPCTHLQPAFDSPAIRKYETTDICVAIRLNRISHHPNPNFQLRKWLRWLLSRSYSRPLHSQIYNYEFEKMRLKIQTYLRTHFKAWPTNQVQIRLKKDLGFADSTSGIWANSTICRETNHRGETSEMKTCTDTKVNN